MRIALISLLAPADDDPSTPLGLLQLAGKTLAARQLELALRLGCERVICVAAGFDRQAAALQHFAEVAGAKFSQITGPRALLGMVGGTDELVGFADGLVPEADAAVTALADSPGVLVLPVEAGLAAGFERIDLNHAWGGMFVMPGHLVERLAELPPDCDTVSALLRIALQGRVPEKNLPEAVLAEGRWLMIQSKAQLAGIEPEWFRRHTVKASPFAPGMALARLAMHRWGAALYSRRVKPWMISLLGFVLIGGGVAGAWLGYGPLALGLFGLGWMLGESGEALGSMVRGGEGDMARPDFQGMLHDIGSDLLLIAVLTLPATPDWAERLFVVLVFIGLLRLAASVFTHEWAGFLRDRALLAVILGLGAAFGVLGLLLKGIALVLLGAALGEAGRTTRLTRA